MRVSGASGGRAATACVKRRSICCVKATESKFPAEEAIVTYVRQLMREGLLCARISVAVARHLAHRAAVARLLLKTSLSPYKFASHGLVKSEPIEHPISSLVYPRHPFGGVAP
jgi:hypothetical protein